VDGSAYDSWNMSARMCDRQLQQSKARKTLNRQEQTKTDVSCIFGVESLEAMETYCGID
jgi:hypothetical protein